MTREEAIDKLQDLWNEVYNEDSDGYDYAVAIDMAIEALQEPKTIIGIDTPYGCDTGIATIFKGKDDKLILEDIKEIMSVVRCKDCRHRDLFSCPLADNDFQKDDDFCSWGERKEETPDADDFCSCGERREVKNE